ncbi:MAG: hypothetical protein AAB452_01610 [Patescibacteria group bacterium]
MDKELEQFVEVARQIHLTDHEKQKVRAHLFAYMEQHPQATATGFFSRLTFYKYSMAGTLAFSLIFIIGISLWAERSLPGDLAYPIKVDVTEKIRDVLAISAEGDLSWHAAEAERRMAEADQLAARGGY